MIVKFDHLSYSCSYHDEEEIVKRFCNTGYYRVQFHEIVENAQIKMQLMQSMHKVHGLTMLQPIQKANYQVSIPIEITSYSEVKGSSPYHLCNEVIEFQSKNLFESISFFRQLGFQEESKGILSLKTMLDKKPYYLRVVKDNTDYPYHLDVTGFSSMAWIVTKIEKYVKDFRELGINVTEIETVLVHNRKLSVCFVFGKYGEIIELIGVNG